MWVWSSAGLFERKPRTNRFTAVPVPDSVAGLAENNNIRTICQDHTGAYWIGSSLGLMRMTILNGSPVYRSFRHNNNDATSLSDNYVTVIIEDKANHLWIGTQQGGLNGYDPESGSFKRYQAGGGTSLVNNNIRDLKTDSLGRLWIGTQGGISILDPADGSFINYRSDPGNVQSLSHNSVYSIFLDNRGTAWIGTYWGGVNSVSVNNTPFHSYKSGSLSLPVNNVVSAVAEDDAHNLWVGTEGAGLNYIDRRRKQVSVYRHLPTDNTSLGSDLVKVIYKDTDGNFWVGTHGGGLNLFNASAKNFTRFFYKENDPVVRSAEVLSMMESRDGIFWVGTQTGLLAFKRTGKSLTPLPENRLTQIVGTKSVKALLQAANGDIWVGTSGDLLLLPRNGQAVQQFTGKDNLPRNNINCIQEDQQGHIWVGCAFGGLARYTPDSSHQKFTTYTKKNGLPDDNITAIRPDEHNNLWISTGNGLCKLDVAHMAFKNYNKSDGLAGNIFNINSSCVTSSHELIFGGFNGITFFHPEEIKENLSAPRTFLTGLKLFEHNIAINGADGLLKQEISLVREISFTYQQNVFTLEFAALNYVQPDKNIYAYTLQGFDKKWNYTAAPEATYMNLPPGDYDFLVKGTNNDGIWGAPVALHIKVIPPIWKTGWAYLLYCLLIIAIAFFVIRFFVLRSLIRREKELTRLKLDFFTNISHEMRSRLSLIIGPAERLLIINKEDYENTRQLQIIRKNSESLLHLLTELMDFRKAESGNLALHLVNEDVVAFLREIFLTFEDRALSMNIRHTFVSTTPAIILPFDKEQLEKVFYNLFYNAYKFTPSGGSVTATIMDKESTVVISIEDTGRGVAPENISKLFTNYFQEDDQGSDNKGYGIGLALAKSIIELHGGGISVESTREEKGNSTVFSVVLKKGDADYLQQQQQQVMGTDIRNKLKTYSLSAPAILPPVALNPPVVTVKKYTILLIEDNEEILTFNREMLEQHYNIITSSNGTAGWEEAVTNIPDVIVSDVMMPGTDGYTLCHKIKSDERTNHIPVILLTAMSATGQQISGLQHGADVYLTKPYSIHMLGLHIGNLLAFREKIHARFAAQFQHAGEAPVLQNEPADTITDPFLLRVIEIIEQNMEDPGFNVDIISRKLAMSRPILYKKLNMLTGLTVNDFIIAVRMKQAIILLENGAYNISEVAYKVGYSDPKYFSREFKKRYGKAPREWKSKH